MAKVLVISEMTEDDWIVDAKIHTSISDRKRPIHVRIHKDSPYYRMSYRGYILSARLKMAEHLQRCLGSDEYIYFKDDNPFNTDDSNMELVSHKELNKLIKIGKLTRRIANLTDHQVLLELRDNLIIQKAILSKQLDDIRFNHTVCNCSQCRRSIDTRQAGYRL